MMEYKGYLAGPINFDPEDKTFSGTVAGLKNGKILVRTDSDLQRNAAIRAAAEGLSLSQWISRQIDAA